MGLFRKKNDVSEFLEGNMDRFGINIEKYEKNLLAGLLVGEYNEAVVKFSNSLNYYDAKDAILKLSVLVDYLGTSSMDCTTCPGLFDENVAFSDFIEKGYVFTIDGTTISMASYTGVPINEHVVPEMAEQITAEQQQAIDLIKINNDTFNRLR